MGGMGAVNGSMHALKYDINQATSIVQETVVQDTPFSTLSLNLSTVVLFCVPPCMVFCKRRYGLRKSTSPNHYLICRALITE